ncbi:DinB family protein [Humisphaera borealis]|uniref:DinB family protein n=1 Tax=Humisphaera borealis TaxID=2807512 RepID=A0A7M2WXE7_9BACT|nr:DinB family protein [Humisphaera borealis]QOV90073.1 DinB family protein [Humisphaera borealis]
MQAIDLVRHALGVGDHVFQGLVADLRDHPMATQAPTGGNHAIWTLGHITLLEAGIPGIFFGESNPLASWEPLFQVGSKPTNDASAYPSFDELLGQYRQQRATTMKILDQVGESGMDRVPAHIPKGFEKAMATFGLTLLTMALHQMLHAGELADIRRAVGIKPMM